MKIVSTIITSAIVAAIVSMLMIPKAEASTAVETMELYVITSAGAMACATTVGYVHRNAAADMLAQAEWYSNINGFMISPMEKVQHLIPAMIFELMSSDDPIAICRKVSRTMDERYNITN